MKIPTLTSDCFLFKTNKWGNRYQDEMDRRRFLWFVIGLTICVTIVTYIWIVYA